MHPHSILNKPSVKEPNVVRPIPSADRQICRAILKHLITTYFNVSSAFWLYGSSRRSTGTWIALSAPLFSPDSLALLSDRSLPLLPTLELYNRGNAKFCSGRNAKRGIPRAKRMLLPNTDISLKLKQNSGQQINLFLVPLRNPFKTSKKSLFVWAD